MYTIKYEYINERVDYVIIKKNTYTKKKQNESQYFRVFYT